MKTNTFQIALGMLLLAFVPLKADTTFKRKADSLTPQNAGRVYDMNKDGIVIYQGKGQAKVGEKLPSRIVFLASKPLQPKESESITQVTPATSHVFEIDLLKFEF